MNPATAGTGSVSTTHKSAWKGLLPLLIGLAVVIAGITGFAVYKHHQHQQAVCVSAFEFDGYSHQQAVYLCEHGQQP